MTNPHLSVPAAAAAESTHRRITVVAGGPMLVEGPVELVLDDGTTVRSDRFVVAVCACRRSKRYPFCDTSHRRHGRGGRRIDPKVPNDEFGSTRQR